MPVVIRVSDEAQALISHAEVARAIGFIKAKARQLTPIMWREAERRRNNIPNRTFYYAMPGSTIGTIELKTNPREQSWHARIIGGVQLAGILAFPRNVDDPNGWIAPFDDPDAEPPVLPPGTPNDANEPEKRAIYKHTGELEVVQGQDFREFENGTLVDWRSATRTDPDTGETTFEILHWHAPSRYFPQMQRFSTTDSTAGHYKTVFYDNSGTNKVTGPGPDIRSVALRNIGAEDPDDTEYVVITGQTATGFTVWARERQRAIDDDVLFPWRELGTTSIATELGTGVVTSGYPTVWETPLHFNRLGTRAVKIELSRNNAPPPLDASGDSGTPHLLEIVVDGEDVTHTLTNVGTTQTSSSAIDKVTVLDGSGGFTQTFVINSLTQQTASPVAADYKIGSDDELGFITTDYKLLITTDQTITQTIISVTFPQVVSNVSWNDTDVRENTVTFNMDGGQAAYTLGPFPIGKQENLSYTASQDTDRSITIPIFSDPGATVDGSFSPASGLPLDEMRSTNRSQYVEIQFADIRYGTMVVKERGYVPEGTDFNAQIHSPHFGHDTLPSGDTPQVVGAVKEVDDAANTLVVLLDEDPEVFEFRMYGLRNRFINRTHIRGRSLDEVLELTDEFYATNRTSGFHQLPEIFSIADTSQSFDSFNGANNGSSSANSDLGTGNATIQQETRAFPSLELQSNVGVNDRAGRFFYSVGLFGVDRQSGSSGVAAGYAEPNPDWDHASFSAYGGKDPVEVTGMPPNEQNGPQGDETNTTRPLFGPMISIQSKTIPVP